MNRRNFLWFTAAGAATGLSARWMPPPGAGERRIEAVAFDAFPILDPRPVVALAERLFPGRGSALGEAWRTRQFQYQWLRALSSRYASFWQATEDSLEFAAEQLQLELTPEKRARLMNAHLELQAWPDAAGALRALQQSGMRLAILSNATPNILAAGVARSGLGDVFEHVLSTDTIRRGRQVVRLPHLLGEPSEPPPRAARRAAGRDGEEPGRPRRLRACPGRGRPLMCRRLGTESTFRLFPALPPGERSDATRARVVQ
jgi:2-haloalkanoic acid dehalogenase type II